MAAPGKIAQATHKQALAATLTHQMTDVLKPQLDRGVLDEVDGRAGVLVRKECGRAKLVLVRCVHEGVVASAVLGEVVADGLLEVERRVGDVVVKILREHELGPEPLATRGTGQVGDLWPGRAGAVVQSLGHRPREGNARRVRREAAARRAHDERRSGRHRGGHDVGRGDGRHEDQGGPHGWPWMDTSRKSVVEIAPPWPKDKGGPKTNQSISWEDGIGRGWNNEFFRFRLYTL